MKKQRLTKEELQLLKGKLPKRYNPLVRDAYLKQTGKEIKQRAVFSFFAGETYTEALHNAALHVAEVYQNELTVLTKRTNDLISQ